MRKHEKVPATVGQVGEIAGVLIGEMNLSKDEAKAIIGNLGQFRKDVRRFFSNYRTKSTSLDNLADLARWNDVYEKLFGKVPDWSTVVIPAKPEGVGPWRLIVISQDICDWTGGKPIQGTLDALTKHFPTRQYTQELDKAIDRNARAPQMGSYAVWVKDVREADDTFDDDSLAGITLLERMLLETDYFFEHGEHLDQQKITRCSGSRYSGGRVPCARWGAGRFGVVWGFASDRGSYLRSRSVRM